jgi:hypothetical protein
VAAAPARARSSIPAAGLVPKETARLETIIHGYEAQLAADRARQLLMPSFTDSDAAGCL